MLTAPLRFRFNSSSARPPTKDPKVKNDGSAAAAEGDKVGTKGDNAKEHKQSFRAKLNRAWSTPTKWFPIPIALGALVLVAVQYRKQLLGGEPEVVKQREGGAVVAGPDGPWQVRILGALPLRSMSRLWGYLNSLVLPVWFRPYGFKLYGWIFGCNMNEFTPEDLTSYESLGQFFYRELKPGVRPIADAPLVSPSDGRVLHCGTIVGEKVEQVKGMTYSLEALLGTEEEAVGEALQIDRQKASPTVGGAQTHVVDDENFANINDIPYSLSSLMGKDSAAEMREDDTETETHKHTATGEHDASVEKATDFQHDAHVAARLGMGALGRATDSSTEIGHVRRDHKLCFIVIYLAPGDYHRFHSPCAWVVERRRHFTGDLFSVSPYVANRLRNLFVLNERVALLGRWKEGFFSMVPVGATNVGSIIVNFDKTLRTNTAKPTHPANTFTEAVYSSASVLQGQPLLPGEEMGGFKLGSTIVLVFEAPKSFQFNVKPGDQVKVGEALGA
ncbi:phosphatidylserine decarboxylase 1 [Vanrija albida]|uniref:Phosphatidylserine decarboxylase proenzyme 1, mitochondrial n=1 Tax=Vanrija albida TaxID=181172 RepID=A0ABR3PUJ5_9TREE